MYRARDTRLGSRGGDQGAADGGGLGSRALEAFRDGGALGLLPQSPQHRHDPRHRYVGFASLTSRWSWWPVGPLRAVLSQGCCRCRQLLQISTQVAEGLAKAHAAGIVHRDLKPENLMVTEDGLVKILDFGLAKLTQSDSSGKSDDDCGDGLRSHRRGNHPRNGRVHVARASDGRSVDYRSDQFSFGSVLYEMATGRRAFPRARQRRRWRRSSRTSRNQSRQSTPKFRRSCDGLSSGAWPRGPGPIRLHRGTMRATYRRFGDRLSEVSGAMQATMPASPG